MTDTNPLRSFRERNVRIFMGGLAISGVGTWAQTTALILLTRELGGGGLELGIVTACQFLPLLLLGLYAGALADRLDRYRMTIVLQVLMGTQAVALGVLDLFDLEGISMIYAMSLVSGLLTAFDNPTRRTLATELVPEEGLANIVSLSTSVITGSRIIGPALSALVSSWLGTAWVFLGNGITFLVFLIAVARMDTSRFHRLAPAPASNTPIRDGVREVWQVPRLRMLIVVFAIVSTFAFNYLVGFPLLIEERLEADDAMFGWLLSSMSVGNVIGSLSVARLTTVPLRSAYLSAGALAVLLGALSFTTDARVALAIALVLGISTTRFVNTSTIVIQQGTNPQMRSRVMALTTVLFLGSTPIGGPITGLVGDLWGALWANLYGALITAVAAAVGLIAMRRAVAARNAAIDEVVG